MPPTAARLWIRLWRNSSLIDGLQCYVLADLVIVPGSVDCRTVEVGPGRAPSQADAHRLLVPRAVQAACVEAEPQGTRPRLSFFRGQAQPRGLPNWAAPNRDQPSPFVTCGRNEAWPCIAPNRTITIVSGCSASSHRSPPPPHPQPANAASDSQRRDAGLEPCGELGLGVTKMTTDDGGGARTGRKASLATRAALIAEMAASDDISTDQYAEAEKVIGISRKRLNQLIRAWRIHGVSRMRMGSAKNDPAVRMAAIAAAEKKLDLAEIEPEHPGRDPAPHCRDRSISA